MVLYGLVVGEICSRNLFLLPAHIIGPESLGFQYFFIFSAKKIEALETTLYIISEYSD